MINEHGAECGDCVHFVYARHESGRINRRHFGKCMFFVSWPEKIPMNYNWMAPKPSAVWHSSNAERCACFERRLT
jgi:hypothetical protein